MAVLGDNKYQFDFEKLEVYQRAINFADKVYGIITDGSRLLQDTLGSQFIRASLSICNNIAEGSRKSGRARVQFYEYSLDSARECVPMITLLARQTRLDAKSADMLRDECTQICRMLAGLIKSTK